MNKIIILVENVISFTNKEFKIGGVQTYVYDLANLLLKQNNEVTIMEIHSKNVEFNIKGIVIKGVKVKSNLLISKNQNLYKVAKQFTSNDDLVIVSTDQMNIRSSNKNVITIQHGIAFDFPKSYFKSKLLKNEFLFVLVKTLRSLRNVIRFNYVNNTVCVDYNFFNWYRTLASISGQNKFKVIPNYTSRLISKQELDMKLQKSDKKRILFARRFVDYRGTLLFANVAMKLLKLYDDIEISFAGDGKLKSYLHDEFKNNPRVSIFSFNPSESVDIHYKYDIAIVPTIFSEGTSLSLCEASGAGCFPIATHVGGMTNMIIDRFNGRLVYPSEEEVFLTIQETLEMTTNDFNKVVRNSWDVANSSFSIEQWELRWTDFINKVRESI